MDIGHIMPLEHCLKQADIMEKKGKEAQTPEGRAKPSICTVGLHKVAGDPTRWPGRVSVFGKRSTDRAKIIYGN